MLKVKDVMKPDLLSVPPGTSVASAAKTLRLPRGWDLTQASMRGVQVVLSFLIVTILLALAGGVVKTFLDLQLLLVAEVEEALRKVLIDTLILLAMVEVFKTTLTYFSEGRVKVTFIVDTILVVMLTEVISQWFKGGDMTKLAILGGILLTLGAIRVVAVRWSPAHSET